MKIKAQMIAAEVGIAQPGDPTPIERATRALVHLMEEAREARRDGAPPEPTQIPNVRDALVQVTQVEVQGGPQQAVPIVTVTLEVPE